jgi:prevent-host-death family protein
MKTSGIRELKAHLSAYVRDVERGESILVTDRGRAVAELRPVGEAARSVDAATSRYERLVARGVIRPAVEDEEERHDRSWATFAGLGAKRGTARAVLDADRGR